MVASEMKKWDHVSEQGDFPEKNEFAVAIMHGMGT